MFQEKEETQFLFQENNGSLLLISRTASFLFLFCCSGKPGFVLQETRFCFKKKKKHNACFKKGCFLLLFKKTRFCFNRNKKPGVVFFNQKKKKVCFKNQKKRRKEQVLFSSRRRRRTRNQEPGTTLLVVSC